MTLCHGLSPQFAATLHSKPPVQNCDSDLHHVTNDLPPLPALRFPHPSSLYHHMGINLPSTRSTRTTFQGALRCRKRIDRSLSKYLRRSCETRPWVPATWHIEFRWILVEDSGADSGPSEDGVRLQRVGHRLGFLPKGSPSVRSCPSFVSTHSKSIEILQV